MDRDDEERCAPRLRFVWEAILKLEAPKSLETETEPEMDEEDDWDALLGRRMCLTTLPLADAGDGMGRAVENECCRERAVSKLELVCCRLGGVLRRGGMT